MGDLMAIWIIMVFVIMLKRDRRKVHVDRDRRGNTG